MKTSSIIFLLFSCAVWCCSEDEVRKEPSHQEENHHASSLTGDTSRFLKDFQSCDSIAILTSIGTSCCVSGRTAAAPGDTIEYRYQINQPNPQVHWEILNGEIVIITGQNSDVVKVVVGPNFTGGIIQGRAKGDTVNGLATTRCEDVVKIKLK
jgi:hypothetical protein